MDRDDHELSALRRRVAALTEEARRNDAAWRRAQRRELKLLEAPTLTRLLYELTDGLRRGYRLDAATLTLADPEHELRQLLEAEAPAPSPRAVVFVESPRALVPAIGAGRPWLGPYSHAEHASSFGATELASVALLPLIRQGRVLGSLNFGSAEPDRFTPTLGTDFLLHLALIAAFSIESAADRARLVRSGLTDALTGWHNRRYLALRLREELVRCRRERTSLTCLMIDVDHFKTINDGFGHAVGDQVLRSLARCIGAQVRASDVSARYGGEEFVVLLPGTTLSAGLLLAERIRTAVAAERVGLADSTGHPLPVTVSIGVAEHGPSEAETDPAAAGDRLLARADAALYEAKAAGRNAVAEAADR